MRRIFLFLTTVVWVYSAHAQEGKTVNLDEVKVEASRIVSRPDGQLIIPSRAQMEGSSNGFSLLSKLGLPSIRVDIAMHTITALGNQGTVQVRINGVIASKDDLLSLDPKSLKNIEFIDNPGVRYGEGIAYVLNLRTQRANEGYTLGTNIVNSSTTWRGNNTVFAKVNQHHSEFGLSYNFAYNDFKGTRSYERSHYLLTNNSLKAITREDISNRDRSFGHTLELKYTLADSASYIFQTTLSGSSKLSPSNFKKQKMSDELRLLSTFQRSSDKSLTPYLDLYFFHKIGSRQSITLNLTGTHIVTAQYNHRNEGGNYQYQVDGKTWSLTGEAIYEYKLKPLTASFGLNNMRKYIRNEYAGNVDSHNAMHNNNFYLFAEIKGRWNKLSYVAGLGETRLTYEQGAHSYQFHLFHPKFTLAYAFSNIWKLRYTFETSGHISQIAMVSDTRIRKNSMEWTIGNPDLRPTRRMDTSLRLSFDKPRINSITEFFFRHNAHPNMACYERTEDNLFLYYQKNQSSIDMFCLQNNTRWDLIPEKLIVSGYGGIYRYFNRGDAYRHYLTAYNLGGSIEAYLGRWTMTVNIDNGWKFMEGETWSRQGAALWLTATYHIGNCDFSLYWQNPLMAHPKIYENGLMSRYLQRGVVLRGSDYGNMVSLNLSWKLNKGRRFREIHPKPQHNDTQTGIME